MRIQTRLRRRSALLLLAALGLAGCESKFSAELSVTGVEDASSVEVSLTGIELRDDQDGIVGIDFDEPRRVDLLDYQDEARLRLLSDEEIPARRYRGIRLVLDDQNARLTREGGGSVPIRLSGEARFAPLELSLSDDDSETARLVLDLRFSLADRSAGSGVYLLQPQLRAGLQGDLGTLVGNVDADFVNSGACATVDDGYAMYLYEAEDRVPSDFQSGATGNPMAIAPLRRVEGGRDYRYAFQGLAEGRYTMSFTCQSELDDPFERSVPGLLFIGTTNLRIESGKEARKDF